MLIRIRESNVIYRSPYYLRCWKCKSEVYANSQKELISKAKGWMYDTLDDVVLCGECASFHRPTEIL